MTLFLVFVRFLWFLINFHDIGFLYFDDISWFSYNIFNLNDVGIFRLLISWFGIETMCLKCVKSHITGSANLQLQGALAVNGWEKIGSGGS